MASLFRCQETGSARLGEVTFQQGGEDGLALLVGLAADQGRAEMELEGAQGGAALLIPGAAGGDPITVTGELLLPGEGIPGGRWLLAQGCDPGFIRPGADPVVQGELAPGEVGAGILLAFGGDIAVGQHLGWRNPVALHQLLGKGANGGDLRLGVGLPAPLVGG